ncbi:MAG: T9SS type A sorting domain-containing protein [Bacteroidetes bacterium]|nr:T9SS type A sorting domain-containing protein [Bacteroidota bacterium]
MIRLILSGLILILSFSLSAQNNLIVENENDNGPGSLRYLIDQANDGDTITFIDVVDTVRLTSGELLINKSLSIIGGTEKVCIIRDVNLTFLYFRIMHIVSSGGDKTVYLCNLQILYGHTPDAQDIDPGGGLYIETDHVVLKKCLIGYNHAGDYVFNGGPWNEPCGRSGHGGGIYNKGNVSLFDCELFENYAGEGRFGYDENGEGWSACAGGYGGGIFNEGYASLWNCLIRNNYAGKGGNSSGGYHSYCFGAKGGVGGGIFNKGELYVDYSVFQENHAGNGGDASGDHFSYGADGGGGGSLYNVGNCVLILSNIFNNQSGEGGTWIGSPLYGRESGDGGDGGAIYNSGRLSAINCLIHNNMTEVGGPYDGNPGDGGGFYCVDSITELVNCTIAHNTCGTVNNNSALNEKSNGSGGGLVVANAVVNLTNTIIAGNLSDSVPDGDDLYGSVNANYSLVQNLTYGNLNGILNITGVDPDYINDSSDFHLDIQSIAINAGTWDTTGLNIPAYDLDSLPRIVNHWIDIGAYECQDTINNGGLSFYPEYVVFDGFGPSELFIDSLYLFNTSTDTLTIFSISTDHPFFIKRKGQVNWENTIEPFKLDPFDYDTIYIRFLPSDTGYFEGTLIIQSDNPYSAYQSASLLGNYYSCFQLSGTITHDTTFKSLCVFITGDVTVPEGVTLVVEPGCHIKFDGPYRMTVQGKIRASGTSEHKIYFTGKMPWEDENLLKYWAGMYLVGAEAISNDSSSFEHCIFEYASPNGALHIEQVYTHISNCIFRFNTNSGGQGGAIYADDNSLTLSNSVIHDNKASALQYSSAYGGGINVTGAQISNILFYNNRSIGYYGYGGGAYAEYSTITNCTFVDNYASYNDSGLWGYSNIIINSIFSNNSVGGENSNISYSCTSNTGIGNINVWPQFIDYENDDFRLSPSSLCIDAGDPDTANFSVPETDLDMLPRIMNGRIDIGVYEYQVVTPQNIQTLPSGFDFGQCGVSLTKTDTLQIFNTGTELLYIDSITVPEGYKIKQENGDFNNIISNIGIDGNSSNHLIICFSPEESSEYSGFINIYSNDPEESILSLPVIGVGELGIVDITILPVIVSPNPTNGLIKVTFEYPFIQLELYDIRGKLIKNLQIEGEKTILLNTSDILKGLYILRLRDKDYFINKKLIIY